MSHRVPPRRLCSLALAALVAFGPCAARSAIAAADAVRAAGDGAAPASARAPSDTLSRVIPMPAVEVTALRGRDALHEVPAQTTVLLGNEIKRSPAMRLATLLAPVPGLYGYQSGANGEPRVVDPRGFTANGEISYLKVLSDGVDTRGLEFGDVDWDGVLPSNVERVEVIGGPGAWLYGDGAEGGIVNVVRAPPAPGLVPSARVRGGSFGQFGGEAALSLGDPTKSLSLDGRGERTDGWRDRSLEQLSGGGAHARWAAGKAHVLVDASMLKADRQDPGALTPEEMAADRTQAENPGDFTNTERGRGGLNFTYGDVATTQWRLAPYYREERLDQVRTIFFQAPFHHSTGRTMGAEAAWLGNTSIADRPLQLNLGWQGESGTLDTQYQDWDGVNVGATLSEGRGTRATQSAFAAARMDWTPALTVRAGLRGDWLNVHYDDHLGGASQAERTLTAASPFVALSARSAGGFSGYASYGGAFHAPTLNQLYDPRPFIVGYTPLGAPIVINISNGTLDPQRGDNFELGARWDEPGGRSLSLTLYDMRVRDEIDFDNANFQYSNIGESLHRGVLASLRLPVASVLAVTLSGAATPTTIRGGDLDGNQINAVPEASAYARADYAAAKWLSFDAGLRWVGRQYLDKENQHPLGEYSTVDLGASARYGHVRAALRVGNLLDRKFADTGFIGAFGEERLVPAAGRGASLALSVE